MTSPEASPGAGAPTGVTSAGDHAADQVALEVLALALQAATSGASTLPYDADQAYLALGLQLVHDDALRLLPAGHEISPEAHEQAQPFLDRAEEKAGADGPAAAVVLLLGEAWEILAELPVSAGASELTVKTAELLQDAKRRTAPRGA